MTVESSLIALLDKHGVNYNVTVIDALASHIEQQVQTSLLRSRTMTMHSDLVAILDTPGVTYTVATVDALVAYIEQQIQISLEPEFSRGYNSALQAVVNFCALEKMA